MKYLLWKSISPEILVFLKAEDGGPLCKLARAEHRLSKPAREPRERLSLYHADHRLHTYKTPRDRGKYFRDWGWIDMNVFRQSSRFNNTLLKL